MDLLSVSARFAIDKTDYDRAIDEASKAAEEFGSDFDSVSGDVSSNILSLEGDYEDLSGAIQDTTSEVENMDGSLSDVSSALSDAASEASGMDDAVSDAAYSMSDAASEAETLSYGLGNIQGGASDAGDSLFNIGDIAGMVAGIFTGDLGGALGDVLDKLKDVGEAVWNGISELAEYGDEVDKQSQKLGISSDAYQEWEAVLQHSGTNIGSMKKGLMQITTAMDEMRNAGEKVVDQDAVNKASMAYQKSLLNIEDAQSKYSAAVKKYGKNSLEARKAAQNVQEAQANSVDALNAYNAAMEGTSPELGKAALALQELGVQVKDSSGNLRAQEDVFKDTIFALQSIDDESRRTAIAQDIFGRSAMELGPLLNTSAEDTQAMIDRVHELGGVLSEDSVKSSAEFQDAMQDFNTAITGLKNMLLEVLLPAATWVINGLTNLIVSFRNLLQGAGEAIGMALQGIADVFTAIFGGLISGASNWGKDLIDNFIGGIKSMWDKAKSAVSGFAGMIKSFLGFSEPEEGPLSNFHTYAPDMVELFAKGIEDNKRLIADAIDDAFSFEPNVTQNVDTIGGQEELIVPRDNNRQQSAVMVLDGTVVGRLIWTMFNEQDAKMGVQLAGVI